MADIEERAEKYAKDHAPTRYEGKDIPEEHQIQFRIMLRDAYLAGSAQTQKDYVNHFIGKGDKEWSLSGEHSPSSEL